MDKQIVNRPDKMLEIHSKLMALMEEKKDALPKTINMSRFSQNCMKVLKDLKDGGKIALDKLDPISVASTFLEGAFLGLDFLNKECYAIPYGNRLQFQTDYRGDIKVVRKYSMRKITDVYAKLVRDGDTLDTSITDGKQNVHFTPKPFNDGEILGAFAVILFEDGSLIYDTMSLKEIKETRDNYSKMSTGKSWKNSFGEMAKKTVLKRVCKLVTLDFETVEQTQSWNSDIDFDKKQINVTSDQMEVPLVSSHMAKEIRDKADSLGKGEKVLQALAVSSFEEIPESKYEWTVQHLDNQIEDAEKQSLTIDVKPSK